MKLKNIYLLLFAGALFSSCADLDIPPRNIMGENVIFGSADGVNSQLARIYANLPIEDFRYSYVQDGLFNKTGSYQQFSCLTGEAMGRDTKGAEQEHNSYWDWPYKTLYEINSFIEKIDAYAGSHNADDVKAWVAEARFARAFVYFSLAKRYGGVILLSEPVDITVGAENLQFPRNSEEETWDFIREDLDYAIANLPDTGWKGRANKYVAAAMQSRAMLFAGSIAKYTPASMQYTVDGVLLCGIPAARATEYFKAAYDASMLFEEGAGKSNYALHTAEMGSTPASIATNFGNIFQKDNRELIFSRYYETGMLTHNFDEHSQPLQTKTGGSSDEINPTVDFIEMFDGLPKNSDGTLKVFDEAGNHILYDSPLDLFAAAEPRLAATVIFPMATFKGQSIELRRGVYTGPVPVSRISPVGHLGFYSSLPTAQGADRTLWVGGVNNTTMTFEGTAYTITGKSGMGDQWDWGGISGMYLRKYLNQTAGTTTHGNVSTTTYIEIRLAEVLLNRAEAALELVAAGQTGEYRSSAWAVVDGLRQRAGAERTGNETSLTLADVRRERRKELAFENKTYWDLKRWRILHEEQNNKIYRALQPFFVARAGKYLLDIHFQEPRSGNYSYNFDTKYYYQPIPNAEIVKNPMCKQNNGY